MISQIPAGAAGFHQLVCDGKTLKGSAVETEDGKHRLVAQSTVSARALGVDWRRRARFATPQASWCVFQQEAGCTTTDQQLCFSDFAGEEPINDTSNRLEKQEIEDHANDTLDQSNTRRTWFSWFPSSLGLSFLTHQGASLEPHAPAATRHSLDRWPRHQPRHPPGRQSTRPVSALDCLACPSKLNHPSEQRSISLGKSLARSLSAIIFAPDFGTGTLMGESMSAGQRQGYVLGSSTLAVAFLP